MQRPGVPFIVAGKALRSRRSLAVMGGDSCGDGAVDRASPCQVKCVHRRPWDQFRRGEACVRACHRDGLVAAT